VRPINPTEELPGSDNLVVDREGFKTYHRAQVTIAAGATHFIIDLMRGEGMAEQIDTHKLMLSPQELRDTQTAPPAIDPPPPDGLGAGDGVSRPLALTVPASIRVGSNCPSKTSCTTFNVYNLDTYVKNGLDDEWISSWNAESLKAGAIAYRSYGVYHVYHPLTANYDICNTTSCQVNDPTDSSTRTNSATDNTSGMIVVASNGNNPFFAEYAAENNDNFCADGFTGSPSANWPCMSDPVDAGQAFNGHGRGMCQWGTQRWAVNQARDYVWIVNHYYNNDGSPSGARTGLLQFPSTPTPTPTPTPIQLLLDSSGPAIDQAAALDSILFLRDPFPVVNAADLLNRGSDQNTRVVVFVANLQLTPGDPASAVKVSLIDGNNQSYELDAEDVRPVPGFNFTQVIFRLPNNLPAGACALNVKAYGQVSNTGTLRIRI